MQIWIALYILICAFEVQKLSKVMFSWSKMNAKVRDLIFKDLKSATGTISCSKHILVHPQGTLACDHIFWGSWKVDINSGSLVSNLQLSSSWSNRFITWFLFLFNWEHWEQKSLREQRFYYKQGFHCSQLNRDETNGQIYCSMKCKAGDYWSSYQNLYQLLE